MSRSESNQAIGLPSLRADPPNPQYAHERLKFARSFRVVILHFARSFDSPLQCELQEVNLGSPDALPHYEALSYTWGNPNEKTLIECCGACLHITKNCEEVLRNLRHTSRTRLLYVDAICIDQDNVAEKEQQIPLMGEIYGKASAVIAWLGAESPRIALAFKYYRRLYRLRRLLRNKKRDIRINTFSERLREYLVYLSLKDTWQDHDRDIATIEYGGGNLWVEFYDKPYFERAWTVQETAVSSNVVLKAGSAEVPLMAAQFAIEFMHRRMRDLLHTYDWSSPLLFPRTDGFNSHEMLEHAHRVQKGLDVEGPRYTFYLLYGLLYMRGLKAFDNRDKLFSVYAVLKDVVEDFPAPDYSKSADELFTLATFAIVTSMRSLDILIGVNDMDRTLSTPSWVVDWRALNMRTEWMTWPYKIWEHGVASVDAAPELLSTINTPADPPRRTVLRLMGRVACTIVDQVADPAQERQRSMDANYKANNGDPDVTKDDDIRAMDCTLNMRRWAAFAAEHTPNSNSLDHPSEKLHDLLLWERPVERYGFDSDDFMEWIELLLPSDKAAVTTEDMDWVYELESVSASTHDAMCRSTLYRTLFSTSDGRLGNAWHEARHGDLVVLLGWARAPAVLRQVGSYYRFISFAYVEGLMDHEAWELGEKMLQQFDVH